MPHSRLQLVPMVESLSAGARIGFGVWRELPSMGEDLAALFQIEIRCSVRK